MARRRVRHRPGRQAKLGRIRRHLHGKVPEIQKVLQARKMMVMKLLQRLIVGKEKRNFKHKTNIIADCFSSIKTNLFLAFL